MSDPLSVPATSVRTVWVFRLDIDEAAAKDFGKKPEGGNGAAWPLEEALGVSGLDPERVEVFKADTLSDIGLARYLIDANGMDEESVGPDKGKLDALQGHVVLVFSTGLPEAVHRLQPSAPLTLVGRYTESLDFSVRTPPRSAAAEGPLEEPETKAPSQGAMSGRIAGIALLVLFALVGLMVWIAG